MASNTTNRTYPYPTSGDSPVVHTAIQNLAASVDTDVNDMEILTLMGAR